MTKKQIQKKIVQLIRSDDNAFPNLFSKFFILCSNDDRELIIQEIKNNGFFRMKIVGAFYKGGLSRFERLGLRYNRNMDDTQAIRFSCFLLCIFEVKIKRYLSMRSSYERLYLNSEFAEAEKLLDEIDKEVGVSLWSCGQRLLLKELSGGLEANKTELSRQNALLPTSQITNAILFFYSCMAEKGSSYENYQADVTHFLSGIEKSNPGRYLHAKISLESSFHPCDISLLLQIDSQYSIIDLFNSVEKCLPLMFCIDHDKNSVLYQADLPLYEFSSLFKNFLVLNPNSSSQVTFTPNEMAVYELIEKYTIGQYEEVIEKAKGYLKQNPQDLQIAIIVCKSLLCLGVRFPEDEYPTYVRWIYSVYNLDEDFRSSVSNLLQLLKMNCGLTFGIKLHAFLYRKHIINGIPEDIVISCFSDPVLHPNFISNIRDEKPIIEKFYKSMEKPCPVSTYLALADITGSFDIELLNKVSSERYLYSKAGYLLNKGEYDKAQELFNNFVALKPSPNGYFMERIERINCALYQALGHHDKAVCHLVDTYFNNKNLFDRLLASKCYTLPKRYRNRTMESDISLVLYKYMINPSEPAYHISAYSNFVENNGFSNVLDALETLDIKDSRYAFFFENVCCINLLRRDATLKMLSITAESARVEILFKLYECNPQKKYISEIQDILKTETVKENIKAINQSRINVDTEKIYLANRSKWEEAFEKYCALVKYDTLFMGVDINSFSMNDTTDGEINTWTASQTTQAQTVFTNIIGQIIEECLNNIGYGLETHLSSRIRHGYCDGQLTGFLSDLFLLAAKTADGEYRLNEHWNKQLKLETMEMLEASQKKFTQEIETIVNKVLSDWLRIRSKEHPSGLFDYSYLLPFCVDYYLEETIDDFSLLYNKVIEAFWEFTKQILDELRHKIMRELVEDYTNALNRLETELNSISNGCQVVQEMSSNCILAKSKIEVVMGEFANVFSVTKPNYNNFTMDELVSCCKSIVEKVRSDYTKAKWFISADKNTYFHGDYFAAFVDILCILINNAFEHCGFSEYENLIIQVDINERRNDEVIGDGQFVKGIKFKKAYSIKVSNTLDDTVDTNELMQYLSSINKGVSLPLEERRKIQGEGGTGLYKLLNSAEYLIPAEFEFYYCTNEHDITFEYVFIADNIICEEDENEASFR